MANKMLIDSTHTEETRVVVLKGNRVEEFDFESAAKKQLRGNIYLAKVTRVEPSLQAAFVDYGGNRHGFLAFSEIHPDYYQIPVADRQALLAEEADAEAEHARGEEKAAERAGKLRRRRRVKKAVAAAAPGGSGESISEEVQPSEAGTAEDDTAASDTIDETAREAAGGVVYDVVEDAPAEDAGAEADAEVVEPVAAPAKGRRTAASRPDRGGRAATRAKKPPVEDDEEEDGDEESEDDSVEAVGGADAMEEVPDRPQRVAPRKYKIQEVIKRRQVLLVQVVKEERGNKGAALTTYLSLAGRYSVLMPNTARGGGISRKITNPTDRKRLKDIAGDLEVPEGMGVILRTAGAARTKAEVKRDFEYLMRLWENVAELTLKSQAPALVYEEGSLVKRAIRDLYNKDIDEVVVAGEDGYREAKDFMRMLMPSHAKNVKQYKDDVPLFTRHVIESQLDQMFQPQVQLRSGGYIVLNQTEALVSIDVNSGRSTREHNIEDTALKTNLEAAEEIARQLRLRDLAGLIVIDFIDMEEKRNNRAVERRMKDCLKQDRARIQVGPISHFGLLEMSRQRIRTSVLESTMEVCPSCSGAGHVRSPSSSALQILRMIEEALIRDPTHNLVVRARMRVALYVLNQKRMNLRNLEERFGVTITIDADEHLPVGTSYVIERGELSQGKPMVRTAIVQADMPSPEDEMDEAVEDEVEEPVAAPQARSGRSQPQRAERVERPAEEESGDDAERRRKRRRRRRRGRDGDRPLDEARPGLAGQPAPTDAADDEDDEEETAEERGAEAARPGETDEERRRRRRGRRGGRRNRRDGEGLPEGDRPRFDRGDRPDRGVRLDPVMWVQPGEQPRDETLAPAASDDAPAAPPEPRRIEITAPAPAPEPVAAAPAPAPEPEPEADPEPVMPVIPDLPELQAPPPAEEDPNRPRRGGWWSRR